MKHFYKFQDIDVSDVQFALGSDRNGKTTITMTHVRSGSEVAMVSCPAITMWPRCTGDGNFGTMWGPSDVTKAKFTLDLNDAHINGTENAEFAKFRAKMEAIDDALLAFVTEHQLKVLGRKNLTAEEVKMLQIRSIRPKYDKQSGALNGHTINLSTPKYAWDGMGGKYARNVTICDFKGQAIPNGTVSPGDVVAATMFANQVYSGVGGDKFGIHWSFQDVSVVCQRSNLEQKQEVSAFMDVDWSMGKPYVDQVSETNVTYDTTSQFGSYTPA